MKMQLSCGCCDSREFCQRNYNPKTGDCSWSVRVLGDHTPTDQQEALELVAGGIPVAGDDLPWGVRDIGGGSGGGVGGFQDPTHLGIALTPQTDSFDELLPIGFSDTEQPSCSRSVVTTKTLSTGLIPDPKGTVPPQGYTVTWSNVSMAQPRFRYDTFQNVSVPTGETGTGGNYSVQLFSNSSAGFIQTDPFAAQLSWGQYDAWTLLAPQSFRGELVDATGGANTYQQFSTQLRRAIIADPTTVEYAQTLNSDRSVDFIDGVVNVNYSATSRALARTKRYIYDGGRLSVVSAQQGSFTGPLGTTVAKLLSIDGQNFRVGNTHDGREIWLHPLLTALGIAIPTSPIILTFAVKTFVRPTEEALHTFANLDGEAEPDGWTSAATYADRTFNGLLYSVGTVTQPYTLNRITAPFGIASSPDFGSLPTDDAEWTGEPDDASLWKKREGFSFDIDSEGTDDVLTVTRNDCPIPPDPDPVDPEEESAP